MTFQNVVLVIALILLIISLVVIGLLIKSATINAKFPPEMGKCPDYFDAKLSNGKLTCSNPLDLGNGTCTGPFAPVPGFDKTSNKANCLQATKCGYTWDGITNDASITPGPC